ncbi:MAG: hypothetical protein ACOYLT_10625 [Flavobacterium sp.]|uniref:hypothetical protein n=1 Tax=Flavobacterium sp. TaxID=239 RepID=UPI003BC7B31A
MSQVNAFLKMELFSAKLTDEDLDSIELEFKNIVNKIHPEAIVEINSELHWEDDEFYSIDNIIINIGKVIFKVWYDDAGNPCVDILDKDSVFLTVEYPKNKEELESLFAKY